MSDAEIIERLILDIARLTGLPEEVVRFQVDQMRQPVLD